MTQYAAEIATGDVVVLYIDQFHFLWDDARGYVWGPSMHRIELPIINQRERQTYYGALDPVTQNVIVVPTDVANSLWTIIFIEYLRQNYHGKRLIVCWDGASYHRSAEMQEYLESLNHGRSRDEWLVTCVQFAPYAPSQNPIEQLWLKAKQYVRKHWYHCHTFQHVLRLFEEAIEKCSFAGKKLRMYLSGLQFI